jgi:N-glycosylase/DNA lyase
MCRCTIKSTRFFAPGYNLEATLDSGQAFRWIHCGNDTWEGVVHKSWVKLCQQGTDLIVETCQNEPSKNWYWLKDYLQIETQPDELLRTCPQDEYVRRTVQSCKGLRILRQEPWECLASFILSSCKQVTQIKQVISNICSRFGNIITIPEVNRIAYTFPEPEVIASTKISDLEKCKTGFRATYLKNAAELIASKKFDLNNLKNMDYPAARARLLTLPGVGPKIADCVLLFAFGFFEAFPMDVWIIRTLQKVYFGGAKVKRKDLEQFVHSYFGKNCGYIQQYFYHYARVVSKTA